MHMIDEIAHPSGPTAPRVTDFFFKVDTRAGASVHERYKVAETGTPTAIVGGTVTEYRYSYVVFVWRSTGWVEVIRVSEEHAETAMVAAGIAEAILSA